MLTSCSTYVKRYVLCVLLLATTVSVATAASRAPIRRELNVEGPKLNAEPTIGFALLGGDPHHELYAQDLAVFADEAAQVVPRDVAEDVGLAGLPAFDSSDISVYGDLLLDRARIAQYDLGRLQGVFLLVPTETGRICYGITEYNIARCATRTRYGVALRLDYDTTATDRHVVLSGLARDEVAGITIRSIKAHWSVVPRHNALFAEIHVPAGDELTKIEVSSHGGKEHEIRLRGA